MAFCSAQRLDLADAVIELLQKQTAPFTTPPLTQPLFQSLAKGCALGEYGKYLKERYREEIPIFSVQWPPLPITKAFNLAMIQRTKVQRGEIHDNYVRLTVTGKVDDILHMKSPVQLENLFQMDQSKRKVILIEGAPGSGKSTLSWSICRKWGAGELFQEFKAVVLVQLRDPEVQAATTLADIFPAEDDAMAETVASQMAACKGEDVLIILDGWDELPHNLRAKSLYHQLIKPQKRAHLAKSAVIVTSRPISSGGLHPLVSSRVEIVGFTPVELRQYFSECLNDDSEAVDALLERVEENPVVASSCYLPLNAAIIVHLFLSGNQSLPTTLHGIFTSLVLCCLSRYRRERLGLEGVSANIESLDNLPSSLQESFRQLCKLAFTGVMSDRVTFSSTDLEALDIPTDVSALGLLQAVPSIVSHKVSVYYNFLHLLIQELLAAYYISFLSGHEQLSHFEDLFDQPRFAAVFQFYAGITRFQVEREYIGKAISLLPTWLIPGTIRFYLSKLAYFLPTWATLGPIRIRDVLTSMIQGGNRQLLVLVLSCLFETDDPALCEFVANQLKVGTVEWLLDVREVDLDLRGTTLSPLDCLFVGYFLGCVCATTTGEFVVDLSNCSIDNHSCKFLMKGLFRNPAPDAIASAQLSIDLQDNRIHEEGARYLARILKNNVIRRLRLNSGIGETGFLSIADATITNSSLIQLSLCRCSLEITENNGPVVKEMLQRNSTLEVLDLSDNRRLSDAGAFFIAEGLKRNSSLKELNLCSCRIGDHGVKLLGEALVENDSLSELGLRGNLMSESGLTLLLEHLKSNEALVKLSLSDCFRSADVQEIINEIRQRNGHSLITVEYW